MSQESLDDVVVIGAGVVGITIALALQMDGFTVRVLDRKGVAAEASYGNAGAFAFSEIEPLAAPGTIRKAPKWLLDPLGPLSIRPRYALKLAPWLYRFWQSSFPKRHTAAIEAQTCLMEHSRSALERLITKCDGELFVRREGQLQLYEGENSFRRSVPGWRLRERSGIPFTLLHSREAIAEIQPGLHSRFTHGAFTPTWLNVTNPSKWVAHLCEEFLARGGHVDIEHVTSLKDAEGSLVEVETSSRALRARQVVVAAGAWSHELSKGIGDEIPLETERGYNTTFQNVGHKLKTHITFPDHGFVVSRIDDGVRVGGAVEFGGLALKPNFKRAQALVRKARAFLPGVNFTNGTEWMGYRPSLPDCLPVIGRSPTNPRVIYAFGHGHLGLTQSAGTAEIVAEIASNRGPPIATAAFRPNRF